MPISKETVLQILAQYERFGWKLYSVLISPRLAQSLGHEAAKIFADCDVKQSDIDAAWFSRPNKQGQIAWELRTLDDNPFALVEVRDADASEAEMNSLFDEIENRLRERTTRHAKAH